MAAESILQRIAARPSRYASLPTELQQLQGCWGLMSLAPDPDRPGKLRKRPEPGFASNRGGQAFGDASRRVTEGTALALRLPGPQEGSAVALFDLDGVVDPDTGEVTDERVRAFLARLPSVYVERSTSGRGLHLYARVPVPNPRPTCKSSTTGVDAELYFENRLAIVTGNRYLQPGAPEVPQFDAPAGLVEDYLVTFGFRTAPRRHERRRAERGESEALRRLRAVPLPEDRPRTVFDELDWPEPLPVGLAQPFLGWLRDHPVEGPRLRELEHGTNPDPSAADAQLAQLFARWVRDPDTIEQLMRATARRRQKWDDRPDWLREHVIEHELRQVEVHREPMAEPSFRVFAAIERAEPLDPAVLEYWVRLKRQDEIQFARMREMLRERQLCRLRDLDCAVKSAGAKLREQKREAALRSAVGYVMIREPLKDMLPTIRAWISQLNSADSPRLMIARKGGDLVLCVLRSDDEGAARWVIQQLSPRLLRSAVLPLLRFGLVREDKVSKEPRVVEWDPPKDLEHLVVADPVLEVPAVELTATVPIIDLSGEITTAGLHRASGTLVHVSADDLRHYVVPEAPTHDDAIDALTTIDDLYRDFPFVGAADWSNAVAMLLAACLAHCLTPVPLFLVRASCQGSGKSLLTSTAVTITHPGTALRAIAERATAGEIDKVVTAALVSSSPVIALDNMTGLLASSVLAAAATSVGSVIVRPLGTSTEVEARSRLFLANGNNLQLDEDLAQRTVPINLDPGMPDPRNRTGFALPLGDGAWLRQPKNRLRFLAAAHTIIRAWVLAGSPTTGAPVWGSFQPAVSVLGGILAWVGIDGFLGNRQSLVEANAERDEAATILLAARARELEAAPDAGGLTAAELGFGQHGTALRELLAVDDRKFARVLGDRLRRLENRRVRVADEVLQIVKLPRKHRTGVALWHVEATLAQAS